MRNGILLIIGLIVLAIVIALVSGRSYNNSNSSGPVDAHLNVNVVKNMSGITITNQETAILNNCEFGINGKWVALFSSPAYSTHVMFSVQPKEQKFISYSLITDDKGAIFDPNTHTINSAELICSANSTEARYWDGAQSEN